MHLSATTKLIAHHAGCARMHSIMPAEPTERIERAIQVINTNSANRDTVLIFTPISGRGLNCARSIDQEPSSVLDREPTVRKLFQI
jgi:hypothetical protein